MFVALTAVSLAIGGNPTALAFLMTPWTWVTAEPVCMPQLPSVAVPVPKLTVPQSLYHDQKSDVVFLPWTPEVGFCDLIRNNVTAHVQGIQALTGLTNLTISQAAFNAHVGQAGKEQRDTCKSAVDGLASLIAQKRNWSEERARETLFAYLVRSTFASSPQVMNQLSGKLFN